MMHIEALIYVTIAVYRQSSRGSISCSEIIKGGSLGHGTAVPGHYDIDLVIYSRGGQYTQK